MYHVYLTCFLLGGTLMVGQFLLGLLGLGGHGDADVGHDVHTGDHDVGHGHDGHDHESNWFLGVLSFRALVAALTFFGLGGLSAWQAFPDEPVRTLLAAVAAAALAMVTVAVLMRMLTKLRTEGTVRIERAVGRTGTVYLRVPGKRAGAGKVTLNLQNRTVEYKAVTPHDDLPTGAAVVVTGVVSSDTVEIAPVSQPGSVPHV